MPRRNRIFQYQEEMTDQETARILIQESEHSGSMSGLFKGVAAFNFMKKLRLFYTFEIIPGDPKSLACSSIIRIYNYGRLAPDEFHPEVTAEGKLELNGEICEPKDLLDLEHAPSGWEIHNLISHYGEIVSAWLEQNPDSFS